MPDPMERLLRIRSDRAYCPRARPAGQRADPTHRRTAVVVAVVAATVLAACGPLGSDAQEPRPDASDQAVDPTPAPDDSPSTVEESMDGLEGGPERMPNLETPVRLVQVAQLSSAIAGDVGPDGRLYLADRGGTVHPLDADGAGPAVLDISDETTTDSERGLLGLAFAPHGEELFVSYTDLAGHSVIAGYRLVDGAIDDEQRRTVLTVDQPYPNHNGGDIAFGPDGKLYIGLGDGGGGGDPLDAGQDLTNILGSMLRIDPFAGDPYAVPGDNPFVERDDARDEIWAYGLRNPWRFSFDARTGALWIADVGQNAREEVNLLDPNSDAGANLGWNLMEGTLPFAGNEPPDHHAPVHEYETTSARCAITGGVVYRGNEVTGLFGAYLYSDFCEGAIRALAVGASGQVVDERSLGVDGGRVVAFAEDRDGEVYVLSLDGAVYRIEPAE